MSDSDSGRESPVVNYRTKMAYRHPKLIDDDRNTKLHYVAAQNDVDGIKAYLRNESQVIDPQNYMGWTPLMMACRRGHFEAVKCLLVHRANATIVNNFGMNALQLSVTSGNLEMTKYILDHLLSGGVSKRVLEDSFSLTSLAILYRHHDILEFLIENHFPIDVATKETGVTPYMLAHAMEFEEAITTLEKHEVDRSKKNYIGHTAANITAIRQNMKSLLVQDQQKMMLQNARLSTAKENHAENLKTEIINQQLRSMLQVKPEGNNTASPTPFYPQMPYLVISPVPNSPLNYLIPNCPFPIERKSSNVSQFLFTSPGISPITPLQNHQHYFFPPDFDTSQYQMTQHMSSSDMILSPVFMSPCM